MSNNTSPQQELRREGVSKGKNHRGLVGSPIVRELQAQGCAKLVLRTQVESNLTRQAASPPRRCKTRVYGFVFKVAAVDFIAAISLRSQCDVESTLGGGIKNDINEGELGGGWLGPKKKPTQITWEMEGEGVLVLTDSEGGGGRRFLFGPGLKKIGCLVTMISKF
ncbi:hypothetical protein C1H46_001119 [Malus baccata]|uniref:Uncharacterized protein n=1 Tax=Malus baccata TaxID=106549 RepID=A0A540NQK6_MALBA|nr:hypothetical protein C1H46_001119 [Malus baccata]